MTSWRDWKLQPADHGTPTGYAHGCRCNQCREAASAERARYREKVRLNALVPRRDGWMSEASCRGKPSEWWFAFEASKEHAAAVAVCAGCPVQVECREYATQHHEVGLWGGVWRPERYRDNEAKKAAAAERRDSVQANARSGRIGAVSGDGVAQTTRPLPTPDCPEARCGY